MNHAAISFVISFLITSFLSGEKMSQPLLHRFRTFIDINSVLSQLPQNTWHVSRLPSEDIVPKDVGERQFLFFREVSTNGRHLGGITSTQVDLFDICFLGWCQDASPLSQDFKVLQIQFFCYRGYFFVLVSSLNFGCYLVGLYVTLIRVPHISLEGKNTVRSRHFE